MYDVPAGWPSGFGPPLMPDGAHAAPLPGSTSLGVGAMNAQGVAGGLAGRPRFAALYDRIVARRSAMQPGNRPETPVPHPLPPVQRVNHLGDEIHTGAPLSGGGIGLPANLLAPAPPARKP